MRSFRMVGVCCLVTVFTLPAGADPATASLGLATFGGVTAEPQSGRTYVTEGASGTTVVALDHDGQATARNESLAGPDQLVAEGDGAWVLEAATGMVAVLDPSSLAVRARIDLGVDPSRGLRGLIKVGTALLFVEGCNTGYARLARFDIETSHLRTSEFALPGCPTLWSVGTRSVMAGWYGDALVLFDTETLDAVGTRHDHYFPVVDVAPATDGTRAWLLYAEAMELVELPSLERIDMRTVPSADAVVSLASDLVVTTSWTDTWAHRSDCAQSLSSRLDEGQLEMGALVALTSHDRLMGIGRDAAGVLVAVPMPPLTVPATIHISHRPVPEGKAISFEGSIQNDGHGWCGVDGSVRVERWDPTTAMWVDAGQAAVERSNFGFSENVVLSPGYYLYRVSFPGNDLFSPATTEVTIEVRAISDPSMGIWAPQSVPADSSFVVGVELRDEDRTALEGAPIDVVIESRTWSGTTDTHGRALVRVESGADAGQQTVYALFHGDEYRRPASAQVEVVIFLKTVITLDGPASVAREESVSLRSVLRTAGGTPVAGAAVTFRLDSEEAAVAETDAQGVARVSMRAPDARGTYPMSASFGGSRLLGAAIAKSTLLVEWDQVLFSDLGPERLYLKREFPWACRMVAPDFDSGALRGCVAQITDRGTRVWKLEGSDPGFWLDGAVLPDEGTFALHVLTDRRAYVLAGSSQ